MSRKKKFLNQEATATVESLSHDGRGITHLNGKTVFLAGGLPGETVQFKYLRQRGSFDEGQVLTVIANPAIERTTPPCPHFGICGGCSLQHIAAHTQVINKHKALQELLWRQAKLEPDQWLPPLTGPSSGYRRKARLGVKFVAKKNRVLVGFRERQGHLIADNQQCEVLSPAIGQRISAFAEVIESLSIKNKIPQLEIAVADNAAAVVIRHLEPFNSQDLNLLTEFGEKFQLRLYLQPGGMDSVKLFYPTSAEDLYYLLPQYQLKLAFHPLHFIQINSVLNEAMIDQALSLLDCQPGDRILDLFCGIGNFSLPMARRGAHVTGVEGDQNAVNQAIYNAELNSLSDCQFFLDDLFQTSFSQNWAKQVYDKILLDPPRSGAESIINSISLWQPQKIVYVSCDLATLTRDSLLLSQQGYHLASAGIMDMFPHTQHAEAIALFIRESS